VREQITLLHRLQDSETEQAHGVENKNRLLKSKTITTAKIANKWCSSDIK